MELRATPLKGFQPVEPSESVALSKGCVALEFPVSTVHPEESFKLRMNGLRFHGDLVPLPEIAFRKSTRGSYVLMGGP